MKTSFATIAFTITTCAAGVFQPASAQAQFRGILGRVGHCSGSHAGGGHHIGGQMFSGSLFHSGGPVYSSGPSYSAPMHHAPATVYQSHPAQVHQPYAGSPGYSQPMRSQPAYSSNPVSSYPSQHVASMPLSSQVVQASGSMAQPNPSMPNNMMPSNIMNAGQSQMNQSGQNWVGQSNGVQSSGVQPTNAQQANLQQASAQQANMQAMRPAVTGAPTAGRSVAGPAANQASQDQNAAQSALQMLASLGGQNVAEGQAEGSDSANSDFALPQFTAAPAASQPRQAGTWQVALPGNQMIQLVLNNDSSFVWTATKDGKSSSFDGRYILENGRLTLVRSNDLQQMSGSWNQTERGASFKLDGTNSSALEFGRVAS